VAHQSPPRGDGPPVARDDLVVDLDDGRRVRAAERLVPAFPDNATLESLSGLAARLLGSTSAQVSLVTDAEHVAAGVGLPPGALESPSPRRDSLCTVTVASGRPLVVVDTASDSRLRSMAPVASGEVGSYLGVPLRANNGEVVGALCAYGPDSREWQERDVVVLEELGSAVIAELERLALAYEHETVLLRLDLAMDAAGVGSWDWDLATGELMWDDRLRSMFGYGRGDFDNTIDAHHRRVHHEDLPRVTASLNAAMGGDGDYAETYRVVLPDATLRWVSARARALHDESGTVVRIIGAVSDVTEQRLAEQESSTALSLLELVARAGRTFAGSLEVDDAVTSLAQIVVPTLADWSIVTVVGSDGALHDLESWHRDPRLRHPVAQFATHRLRGSTYRGALGEAIASREPVFLESGGFGEAEQRLLSEAATEALRHVPLESVAIYPLVTAGKVVGALTLARGPGRPPLRGVEAAAAAEVAERATTTLDNAHSFSRIRDISEQLQRSMLEEPVGVEGLDIAVRYTPASQAAQVGGDWYDAFVQDDGATMLVVGDVIGHDSAAAAAMGQLRALTRGIAYASGATPAGVLSRVANAMAGLGMDTIATVVIVKLLRDPVLGTTRMLMSNGGHPPPVVLRPDGTTLLHEEHGTLLGLLAEGPRSDQTLDLEPGSVVLLFTDGLVERRGESLDVGFAQLRFVIEAAAGLSLHDLLDHVHREMVPPEHEDDVAVLAVKIG
jgi:serine phosphatase RsbU (regulator of sigma subunit)/PAS domain-containing protein